MLHVIILSFSHFSLATTPQRMTGTMAFRTIVVYGAAVALRECFKKLNVRWAVYGDLAWYLLCGSETNSSWELDVQVMGDSSTLAYVTQGLASADHRFFLASRDAGSKATMTYVHDVLKKGSQRKRHDCQVKLVSGSLDHMFIVNDLPLLPIQIILSRYMETFGNRSKKKLKKCFPEIVAISDVYLRLPNLPPPVWNLTLEERPLFLKHLAILSADHPEIAVLFARLYPGPSLSPAISPDPPFIAQDPRFAKPDLMVTGFVDISSLSVKERKEPGPSDIVLAATRILSSFIRQQGHDCFLTGPGYTPWYIIGSPIVPTDYTINFLVTSHNGNSLDSLQTPFVDRVAPW
ncbi:hypothetical protein F5146DRAFT_652890 [Armillaria mellea]|nr:hypothetical protein F5146DRAFT_652890 [Armillaria mellea]